MKTILFFLCLITALRAGTIAPKDWMPEARDVEIYHWPTNAPVKYRDTSLRVQTSMELPALPKDEAADDVGDPPALFSLAWDASKLSPSNGVAAGYLVFYSMAPGSLDLLATTLALTADVPAVPGTYYVAATNQYGTSPLSTGLVWPKPTTNIYTLSATVGTNAVANWPAQVWQVPNLPADQQYFCVRYTPTNGVWRASCVFSGTPYAPRDSWTPFVPWPAFQTTNQNIVLHLPKVTL